MNGFGSQSSDRKAKFAKSLTALNEQFRTWVQAQDAAEVWTDGVEDYLTYAKKLLKEYDDVLDSDSGAQANESSSIFGRLGGAPAPSAVSAPPMFNFGAPAAAGTSGFFGGFGAQQPGSAPAQAAQEEDNEEDEEEEEAGPSVELESATANILLSQRVTLNSMNPDTKKWTDRGAGTLTVRQSKTPSTSGKCLVYLMFTQDTGRVLVNAPLVKGMKPMVNAKAPKNIIMLLISKITSEDSDKPCMQLFKCENVDAAKGLLAVINEHV